MKTGKLALLLPLLLLLCACARGGEADRIREIEEHYVNLLGAETDAAVFVPRQADSLAYALHITWEDNGIHVAVREPEELAGITAVLAGDALSLRYDGGVLDSLSVEPRVSAVNCVPLLLRAAAEGYAAAEGVEERNGADALRVAYETEFAGAPLRCTLWFDEEDRPLSGEIEADGKIIASAEFTNFKFGDILHGKTGESGGF